MDAPALRLLMVVACTTKVLALKDSRPAGLHGKAWNPSGCPGKNSEGLDAGAES